MIVLDASAVLAYLFDEPGGVLVGEELTGEGSAAAIAAANWSEVAQKLGSSVEVAVAKAILTSNNVSIEPVTAEDGERAASLWEKGSSLSLGDRLCMALGTRLSSPIYTADSAWGESESVIQIR